VIAGCASIATDFCFGSSDSSAAIFASSVPRTATRT
jgi:hypothetical protein